MLVVLLGRLKRHKVRVRRGVQLQLKRKMVVGEQVLVVLKMMMQDGGKKMIRLVVLLHGAMLAQLKPMKTNQLGIQLLQLQVKLVDGVP